MAEIQNQINSNNSHDCVARPMGGRVALITNSEEKGVERFLLKGGRLQKWFIKPWHMLQPNLGRIVWLRFYGIPLQIWIEEFIAKLSSRWGELILVDSRTKNRSNLIFARVQVHTQITGIIAGGTEIKVDGAFFKVRISEEMPGTAEAEQEGSEYTGQFSPLVIPTSPSHVEESVFHDQHGPPKKHSLVMEGERSEYMIATRGKTWEPAEDTEKAVMVSRKIGVQKAPCDTESRGDGVLQ
ncbi:hypothetical protein Ancab_040333 [Ancistrocladus abbreviatus]